MVTPTVSFLLAKESLYLVWSAVTLPETATTCISCCYYLYQLLLLPVSAAATTWISCNYLYQLLILHVSAAVTTCISC